MPREITEEQLARVLVDINRLIKIGTSHAEQARKDLQAPIGPWNKGNQKKWVAEFPRLHAMAIDGNFSEVLDALHEALEPYRDAPK